MVSRASKAAVVIAPLTAEGKFVLIREERIPIRAAIWSFPAGQIDESLEPDEERCEKWRGASCAKRPVTSLRRAES